MIDLQNKIKIIFILLNITKNKYKPGKGTKSFTYLSEYKIL